MRRIGRGFGRALAALLVVLLLAAGAAAWWLGRADLRPLAERVASETLGRRVTLDRLVVRWGDPLEVEIAGLAIANAPWGKARDMARIGRLSARIALGSLLAGELRYQRLRIADAAIALERDRHGAGNWQIGDGAVGLSLLPNDRSSFPTLIDFLGERGTITYRGRGGTTQRIRLDRVAIAAPDDQTPVRLLAHGAYNAVAAQLEATTGSFAALRDASEPLAARFALRAEDTDLAFNGRLWNPLDFDGVRGEFSIESRALGRSLAILGLGAEANLPLSVAGILRRDGDCWSLAAAKGRLHESDFAGDLALTEGEAGAPDLLALDLNFGRLDLDSLIAALGGDGRWRSRRAIPLAPAESRDLVLAVSVSALRARIGGRTLHALLLRGRTGSGEIDLQELSLALGGGTLKLAGSLARQGPAGRLELQARLAKANVTEVARALGLQADGLRGRLDGAAKLSMAGATLDQALKASAGGAVIALSRGTIARDLVERLSGDLRRLFRSEEGSVPVSCLLGIVTVENGVGVLSPLRFESPEAVATGAGTLDLAKERLDLTIRTDPDSTGAFALDLPVRISGPLHQLRAEPLTGSDGDRLKQPTAAHDALPAELDRMVRGNGCRD